MHNALVTDECRGVEVEASLMSRDIGRECHAPLWFPHTLDGCSAWRLASCSQALHQLSSHAALMSCQSVCSGICCCWFAPGALVSDPTGQSATKGDERKRPVSQLIALFTGSFILCPDLSKKPRVRGRTIRPCVKPEVFAFQKLIGIPLSTGKSCRRLRLLGSTIKVLANSLKTPVWQLGSSALVINANNPLQQ